MIRTLIVFITLTGILCGAQHPPMQAGAKRVRLVTREVSLGKQHPGEIKQTLTLSPDNKRVAFVAQGVGGEFVVVDGVAGKHYATITRDPINESGISLPIVFSPDSRRVAYVAKRGGKYLVVHEGKESAEYDFVYTGAPHFSPDSRRLVYTARRGGKFFVVVDGVEGKAFDQVTHPEFSRDGRRVAHAATRNEQKLFVVDGVEFDENDSKGQQIFYGQGRLIRTIKRGDKELTLIDGVEGKPYDSIGCFKISADQKRIVYEARLDGKWFVVADGVEGKKYLSIDGCSIELSPDGKHFAYKVQQSEEHGDKQFVVADGKEGQPYYYIGNDLVFTPDSQHLMYQAFRDGKTILVTDGREGASFDGIPGYFLRFSPDGKRMIYHVQSIGEGEGKSKETLVVDGEPFVFDGFFNIVFSPDSRRLLFKARRGNRWLMVIDGVASKEYDAGTTDDISFSEDDEIAFSPDSRRVAYVAQKMGKEMVVVDGAEGKLYDDINNLQFTHDGRHYAYTAQRGAKYVVVVNGVESKEYDSFLKDSRLRKEHKLNLDGERSLSILAMRAGEFVRVELEIVEE